MRRLKREHAVMKALLLEIHEQLQQTNRVIPLELATYAGIDNAVHQIKSNREITAKVRP